MLKDQVFLIVHKATHMALATNLQDNKLQLASSPPNNQQTNQLWRLSTLKQGKFIMNLEYHQYLSAKNGKVKLEDHHSKDASDIWSLKILHQADSQYQILTNKGKLQIKQNQISINSSSKEEARWILHPVNDNFTLIRSHYILTEKNNKALQVGSKFVNKTEHLTIGEATFHLSQKFILLKCGQVYVIKTTKADLNLVVENGQFHEGSIVMLYTSTGSNNQFWDIQKVKEPDLYRISCFTQPSLELGIMDRNVVLRKKNECLWKISGDLP